MPKYYIKRIGDLFSCERAQEGVERPEDEWMTLNIEYADNLVYSPQSDGIISIEVESPEPAWSEFQFNIVSNGSYIHQFGYGKVFTLGWNIKDKENNSHVCLVHGGDLTNSWGYQSIARGIVQFLNILYQYKNLDDYKAAEESQDEALWKSKDTCDKILQLANVISLYKKYKEINPALGIVKQMENLIEKRLLSLTTESK